MQQLYATIKKSSKYAYQQPRDDSNQPEPFEVEIGNGPISDYIVYGNSNQYRISDLRFYVKTADRLVPISK